MDYLGISSILSIPMDCLADIFVIPIQWKKNIYAIP